MEYKYINEARTQELIDEVKRRLNARLVVTDVMPESAEDGAMRLYSGETDVTYAQSHIYRYNEAEAKWEDVTADTTVIETVDELPTGNEIKDIFYRTTTGGWRGEYEFQIVAGDNYRQVIYNQLDKIGWKYKASMSYPSDAAPGSVVDLNRGYTAFLWFCHSAGTKIGYDDGHNITEIKGMVLGTGSSSVVYIAQLLDVDYMPNNLEQDHIITTKVITGGSDTLSLKVWHEAGLYIGDSATQTVTQIYPVIATTKETKHIPCGVIPAERETYGTIIQFLDSEYEAEGSNLTRKYKAGHYYTCSYDSETHSYHWTEINTSDSVVWVADFPTYNIEDVIYGKITTTTEYTNEKNVGLDSLDTETRITLDGDDYIPASTDDVYVKGGDVSDYEVFVSFNTTTSELTTSVGTYTLESETELTFATQTTTETKSLRIGNEERQELIELENGSNEVIANPSETATETLSKVSIGGTVYEVGGDTIQVETLPTAGASEVGNIYQYIGETNLSFTNGYFYECVEDSGSYNWVEKEVQKNEDVPHWSGTRAEYEAQKDNIEDGTYVSILDDIDTHELVDVVEEDNMNPVTSNAVYDAILNNVKKGKFTSKGVYTYNGATYFIPQVYAGNDTKLLVFYVNGENNCLGVCCVNSNDLSGFSYVDGILNNSEYITYNNERFQAFKVSNDSGVGVAVFELGLGF